MKINLPLEYFTHLYEKGKAYLEPTEGRVLIELDERVDLILGRPGKLISPSKSFYLEQHPDHKVYFNACIFNRKYEEIWFGDIDLTKDTDKLQRVANVVGDIYVTREMPYRFKGLTRQARKTDTDIIHIKPDNKKSAILRVP